MRNFVLLAAFAAGIPATSAVADSIRFATFNASLNRNNAGDLISDLSTPGNAQAQAVAEIIQRVNPDVLLINEFDYDANGTALNLFRQNYLEVGQNTVSGTGAAAPVNYQHSYVAPSNTGVASGFDLDNSGAAGDFAPGDAQGFGFFEGQFGFAVLSKYEIKEEDIRTFQNFLWKDMPDAKLPADPLDADGNGDTANWYTPEELEVVRLSSKNHVDVPIEVGNEIVHLLASHPTPPVFDGSEDRNGTRNHDEIRFWADYIADADYIYDDLNAEGGLELFERFVIAGDLNADPFDGDSTDDAVNLLLDNDLINGSATEDGVTPDSEGGPEQAALQGENNDGHAGNPAFDTSDFGDTGNSPGNLRVDYVLPSTSGLSIVGDGIYWLASSDPLFGLVGASDHRLTWIDVEITPKTVPVPGAVFLLAGGLAGLGVLRMRRRAG